MIKTTSYDQTEILTAIMELHNNGEMFDCDVTFGNGGFYKRMASRPGLRFDIHEGLADTITASSTNIPVINDALKSVVFDPPFLCYVKASKPGARNENGGMVMADKFSGYWRYNELEEHYRQTFADVARVLRDKGIMILKCQDIIHNHALKPTHILATVWAAEVGFRLLDMFILNAKHRMPQPKVNGQRPKQKHARVYHSYFMVFKVTK